MKLIYFQFAFKSRFLQRKDKIFHCRLRGGGQDVPHQGDCGGGEPGGAEGVRAVQTDLREHRAGWCWNLWQCLLREVS